MRDDDHDFDPMIYDAMRELATRVSGQYIAWKREARTAEEAAHWQAEAGRIAREVRSVDTRSRRAIEAKRAELRDVLAGMPEHAPAFRS
jgi:hypothetical protein